MSAIQAFGQAFSLIGGDNLTDATTKVSRIGSLHYTNSEEPMGMLFAQATSTGNNLNIGGGTSSLNGATQVVVYTAADNVTPTGTPRWYWDTTGSYRPWADASYDIGAASIQIRDLFMSRYLRIGGAAPAGASGLATVQAFGNAWAVIGGSNLTDATTKETYFGSLHYTNTAAPVAAMRVGSNGSSNYIYIGGAVSNANAATEIAVVTGATTTTLNGTTRWIWNSSGHFLAAADNTYDIGASGASRARSIYAGTSIVSGVNFIVTAGGSYNFSGRSLILSPSDGVLQLSNAAITDFSRLQFGGTTSSFPALKRSATVLQARLADDSGFASLQAKLQTHANAVAETPTATHTLTLYDAAGTAYRVLCVA
jgi:hypothetical protein